MLGDTLVTYQAQTRSGVHVSCSFAVRVQCAGDCPRHCHDVYRINARAPAGIYGFQQPDGTKLHVCGLDNSIFAIMANMPYSCGASSMLVAAGLWCIGTT